MLEIIDDKEKSSFFLQAIGSAAAVIEKRRAS